MGHVGTEKLAEDLKPEEVHVNVKSETFTDADLKATGQDWGDPKKPVGKIERLAEVYIQHAGQTPKELAEAIADVLEEHDAKDARMTHEAQFRATGQRKVNDGKRTLGS